MCICRAFRVYVVPRYPQGKSGPKRHLDGWWSSDDLGYQLPSSFPDFLAVFLRHLNRVNTLLNVVTRSRLVLFHCFIPSCPPFGLKLRTKVLSHCTWLSLRQFPAKPFLALFRSRCAFRRTQANSFSCTRSEVDFHQERSWIISLWNEKRPLHTEVPCLDSKVADKANVWLTHLRRCEMALLSPYFAFLTWQ